LCDICSDSSPSERALELDDTIASAHITMSSVHVFSNWDWAAAEAEAKRAVELSPGEPLTHALLADHASIRGRHSEAVTAYRRVLELDPISRVYLGHLGLILYRGRRSEESMTQCRRALEIDPQYGNAMWFLSLSLEQTGALAESIVQLEKVVGLIPAPHYRALLGRAYAMAGERTKAVAILGELMELSQHRYISPFDIGVIHAGLGDRTAAFACFEEAYQQRVFRIIELMMPMFAGFRSDSRWQDLVRRIGLPQ
jgi:eukaryotic-like serine/threonine-protein kinase